jgi:hypothetical protein
MITKLIAGAFVAAGVAVSPMSIQTADAHPPGPKQCWVYSHHHWKWICKRTVRPAYTYYDPYVYSYPYPGYYQPYYYSYPTFGFFVGGGGGYHHHHKNWDWKKH